MMQETLLSGTARKAEIPGWTAAGKTGTSQDFRDAWFIGYTANLVTGVWLGNDDNSPTRKATGGGLPVEVWTRFMRVAHQGVPVAALPGIAIGRLVLEYRAGCFAQSTAPASVLHAARRRCGPAGADAHLGAPASRRWTRWLADGPAVRRSLNVQSLTHSKSSNLRADFLSAVFVHARPIVHFAENALILNAVAMQIVAGSIEPGLGALDMIADPARPPSRTAASDSSRPDARPRARRDNPAHRAARGSAARRTTTNPPRCMNPSGSTDRGSTAASP